MPNLRMQSSVAVPSATMLPRYGTSASTPASDADAEREVDADHREADRVERAERGRDQQLSAQEARDQPVDGARLVEDVVALARRHPSADARDDRVELDQQVVREDRDHEQSDQRAERAGDGRERAGEQVAQRLERQRDLAAAHAAEHVVEGVR